MQYKSGEPIGEIFEIVNVSAVDGPGLRTVVFFSNCNMRCKWCHNPESWAPGGCKTAYTISELMEHIYPYREWYKATNGGVTFSGGECLLQPKFIITLAKECFENDINVAIDTAGNVEWNIIENILPYVDLFLYDLKCITEELHIKNTGVSNEQILFNLNKLSNIAPHKLAIRIPLIVGFNTDTNELSKIKNFLSHIEYKDLTFLPYHNMSKNKYEKLGLKFIDTYQTPSSQVVEIIKEFM